MTELNTWLQQATRSLAEDSAAQVRAEIQEHYQLAHEAAIADGATPEEADALALKALGDARATNRQYRRVLLTAAEAKVLRDSNREARAICSRPWLKRLLLALPGFEIIVAGVLFLTGHRDIARNLLVMALGMSLLTMAPLFPICTPVRGRIFRWVKWLALVGAFAFALTPAMFDWSWIYVSSCLWPMLSTEWTRAELRRKLPVESWPKHLYL